MIEPFKSSKAKSTRTKGAEGEDIAEEYLMQKGFHIIKRNFIWGKIGEIDIVAMLNNQLVFVEVKTKTSKDFGDPLDWITPRKQKQLRTVAKGYFYVNQIYEQDCRFDVITVDLTDGQKKITHIENAM